MKVAEILKTKGSAVATVLPEMSIQHVAKRLRVERIGALVVSADGQHVDGIVTERDIVHGLAQEGARWLDRRVGDVVARSVRTCASDDRVRDVMAEMTRARVRHLPVVTDGTLCGIVSIGDVVKSCLDDADLEVSVLRDAYLGHR
jgi:signal-transduction protein with cAMP-binding, CBS, and nucleotidyltransferase domain